MPGQNKTPHLEAFASETIQAIEALTLFTIFTSYALCTISLIHGLRCIRSRLHKLYALYTMYAVEELCLASWTYIFVGSWEAALFIDCDKRFSITKPSILAVRGRTVDRRLHVWFPCI